MIAERYVQYMVAYRVSHDTLENSIAGEHFTAQKAMDVGYSAGDFVVYNDEFYRCKQSYKDYILPTNTSYWEKIILTSYFSHSTELNYSTTEQVVGTWIDGKPIYRRVLTNIPIGSSNVNVIDSSVSYDKLIKGTFTLDGMTGNAIISNACSGMTLGVQSNSLTLVKRTSADYAGWNLNYVIIEYTKTTD